MAGAGKTQTTIDYVKEWREAQILYLVFNKNMEEEMKRRAHESKVTAALKIMTVDAFCRSAQCAHVQGTKGTQGRKVCLDSPTCANCVRGH